MKRIIAVLLMCLILTACFIPSATAAEATNGEAIAAVGTAASGTCGENASWSLSGTTLTITGSGKMYDYNCKDADTLAPWYSYRNDIETIVVGEGITNIGNSAFYALHYADSVSLPSTLTDIGDFAFYISKGVTSITIPSGVTRIGESAFDNCKALKTVDMPYSVETFGKNAFAFCESLTSLHMPASLKSIGKQAFSHVPLTSLTLPEGFESIGDFAFWNGGLETVTLPSTIKTIGDNAFYVCRSLRSINLPDSLESIGKEAFVFCGSLTSIVIPDGITEIKNQTFSQCTGLTRVVLPDSVKKIGDHAFYNCNKLSSINVGDDVEIGKDAFTDCKSLVKTPIKITANPADTEVEHAGDVATLRVRTTGGMGKLTYTWYYKNPSWKNWSKSTQNSRNYSIAVTDDRYGRKMYCVVTDALGQKATSSTATLTYRYGSIEILTQPQSVKVEQAGDTATVSIEAEGEDLAYTWYYKNPDWNQWSKSTQTGPLYKIKVTEDRNNRKMYCVVSDKNGNTTKSKTITLSYKYARFAITTQPQSVQVAKAGNTATLNIKAIGEGLTYTWYYKNPDWQKWSKSDQDSPTYSIRVTKDRDGRQMYCVVTDKNGRTLTSDTVTLTYKK